jgi:hypothetical protein
MTKKYLLILCALVGLIFSVGCSTVKPWRRGNFAKAQMQYDPDPLDARFRRHVFESKEATRGGSGALGGGCGCK